MLEQNEKEICSLKISTERTAIYSDSFYILKVKHKTELERAINVFNDDNIFFETYDEIFSLKVFFYVLFVLAHVKSILMDCLIFYKK